MRNNFVCTGRIPFDLRYNAGENGKSSMISGVVDVQRNYKKSDEQYYPSDLIPFVAFGAKADFINSHFSKGDYVDLSGRMEFGNDYTDSEGNVRKGNLTLKVENVEFVPGKAANAGNSVTSEITPIDDGDMPF